MAHVVRLLTEEQWGDALFAWRVCKHVGSNAIVLAKELQTIGIGAGQQSRVDAVKIALAKAREFEHDLARSTVLTMMERLRKKRRLVRRMVDGVYRYRANATSAELMQGAVERFAADGRDSGISLPSRGEPCLRALATSCRDFLGALRRSLCSSVLATRIGIGLSLFCDALFGLVREVARPFCRGYCLSRALVGLGRFFDRGKSRDGFIDILARAVFDGSPRLT